MGGVELGGRVRWVGCELVGVVRSVGMIWVGVSWIEGRMGGVELGGGMSWVEGVRSEQGHLGEIGELKFKSKCSCFTATFVYKVG